MNLPSDFAIAENAVKRMMLDLNIILAQIFEHFVVSKLKSTLTVRQISHKDPTRFQFKNSKVPLFEWQRFVAHQKFQKVVLYVQLIM